jgi:monofunctional biosynthetic peptidoglycan transglycosylase
VVKSLIVLALLPYVLILVYRLDFVRPVSTLMLWDLVTRGGYERQWVEFEDISPVLVQSVMMSEDGQFCSHRGVDWVQMNSVLKDALEGESTRGASTIPMQTVKNLFLWNGRSFLRKGLELPLAMAADFAWSKKRLMEIYLNIAEWGPGIYGVEAAARARLEAHPPAGSLACRRPSQSDHPRGVKAGPRHETHRKPHRAPGARLRRLYQMSL